MIYSYIASRRVASSSLPRQLIAAVPLLSGVLLLESMRLCSASVGEKIIKLNLYTYISSKYNLKKINFNF